MIPQLAISLRLHFRNRLALLYSYLFPTIFLIAFWVLYRHDPVPLVRHMGALLTVTILGGACFGLPTTLVSERERGVWRRYRLAPVSTGALLVSTVVARYLLLLVAGLLQVVLAVALGMPWPPQPGALWLAFTCVAAAFLGLGLVLAMLAPTVPAVQALGQCVFLPMLILGGIAVPMASLPEWAQQIAAFLPGVYAVDALQATITGPGLGAARGSLLALLLMAAAGCLAATRVFRWDTQQRLAPRAVAAALAIAVAAWLAVGVLAVTRERTRPPAPSVATIQPPAGTRDSGPAARDSELGTRDSGLGTRDSGLGARDSGPGARTRTSEAPPVADSSKPAPAASTPAAPKPAQSEPVPAKPATSAPPPVKPLPEKRAAPPPAPPAASSPSAPWRAVTVEQIERDVRFDRLPPDAGVVTPIAPSDDEPDTDLANTLDYMSSTLLTWKPAQVADPVQRVRNVLYVAAAPDVFQMDPLERFAPWVVFEHLRQTIPKDDLVKILYWIALHPTEGDDSAVDSLRELRLGNGPADMQETRQRAAVYAVKLLGRLLGKIPAK